jgi:hypothetical protein
MCPPVPPPVNAMVIIRIFYMILRVSTIMTHGAGRLHRLVFRKRLTNHVIIMYRKNGTLFKFRIFMQKCLKKSKFQRFLWMILGENWLFSYKNV